MKLIIGKDGRKIKCIYSDVAKPILEALGKLNIKRVSHVEPDENGKWWADMSPLRSGIRLGPFNLRQEALDAEIKWLEEFGL